MVYIYLHLVPKKSTGHVGKYTTIVPGFGNEEKNTGGGAPSTSIVGVEVRKAPSDRDDSRDSAPSRFEPSESLGWRDWFGEWWWKGWYLVPKKGAGFFFRKIVGFVGIVLDVWKMIFLIKSG